jgi:peroxiredoxin
MSQRRLALVAIVFCVGALLLISVTTPSRHAVSPGLRASAVKTGFLAGDHAPDFDLHSLAGRTMKLSDFRGHPVILNFWATWCAPCRVETPWLVELDRRYRAKGVQILGVSLDDVGSEQAVATFNKEQGIQYAVLLGNSSVADAYGGVRFMPQSFFIDREGAIKKTTVGMTDKEELENNVKELLTTGDGVSQLLPERD